MHQISLRKTIEWQCDKPHSKYETTHLIINPLTRASVSVQKKTNNEKKTSAHHRERHFNLIIACTSAVTVVCGFNLAQYFRFPQFQCKWKLPLQFCQFQLISLAFFRIFNSKPELSYGCHLGEIWLIVAILKSMFIPFSTHCFRSIHTHSIHK